VTHLTLLNRSLSYFAERGRKWAVRSRVAALSPKGIKTWVGQARGTKIGQFSQEPLLLKMAVSSRVIGHLDRVRQVRQIRQSPHLCQTMTLSLGRDVSDLVLTTAIRRGARSKVGRG
jgi:hypothetical protein